MNQTHHSTAITPMVFRVTMLTFITPDKFFYLFNLSPIDKTINEIHCFNLLPLLFNNGQCVFDNILPYKAPSVISS